MSREFASERRRLVWNSPLSIVAGAILLLVVVFAGHRFLGPESVTAQAKQAPGRRPAARSGRTPASAGRQPASPVTRGQTANPRANRNAVTGFAGDTKQVNQNIVAVVNGQSITRQVLGRESMRRYGKEVLESIVNKHLIMQECQQRGITITNQDVENEVDDMASKFGLSKDRWLNMLESEREIKPEQYRREIIWPMLALCRLAAQRIVVSTEELGKAYESQYGSSVKVRVISVASQERATQLLQMAKAAPDDFGDLAKKYSEDTNSAAARGMIPPIRRHVGNQEIERVAFSLMPGEISRIIHAANQYLILQCVEHIPAEKYVAGEDLDRIKRQLHDQIRDKKLRDAATDLFQELQERAQVTNVFNNPALRQQMPGVAATVNNRQIKLDQLSDECLLRHGKDVLEGEINRLVLQQQLTRQGRTVTERQIDEEIARAADAYGFVRPDNTPDVEAWLKTVTDADGVTVELYVRDAVWPSVALKSLVADRVQVSSEDLEKGYESNYGERVKVLVIVLAHKQQAVKVWEQARDTDSDEAFGALAHEYSIEPVSRANFGKVPPVRHHSGQPFIEEEAFRLQKGDLSTILVAGNGKHIIMRCLGRTKPVDIDRQEIDAELRKDIQEKKLRLEMAKEFDRLKISAQIDNFLAGTTQLGKRQARQAGPATANRQVERTSFQPQPRAPAQARRR